MKPIATLIFGLALAGAADTALAQQSGPADKSGRHAKIDTNGDGAIDRSEAAAHPKLAEHFDRLDKNKDGRIDASERPQHHGKGGGGGGRRGERGERTAKLDSNGDGAIDRSEAATVPKLAEHFDRLDKNKDGRIDASERPQRHGKGGDGGGRRGEHGERMAKIDTDGDGRFSRSELAGREKMLAKFGDIDANKDGYLTREEMRAFHQRQRAMPRGEKP